MFSQTPTVQVTLTHLLFRLSFQFEVSTFASSLNCVALAVWSPTLLFNNYRVKLINACA